jgi:Ca2+-binding EF-hand superfamily protein
MKAPTFTFTDA